MANRSSARRRNDTDTQPQGGAPQQERPNLTLVPQTVDGLAQLRANLARLATDLSQTAYDAAMAAGDPAVTAAVTAAGNGHERTTPMNATPQTTANVPTFNDLLQVATDLGTQAGQGKDTQIKFDLKLIEAAYLGAINLDPNKHGKDRRDGIVLAEAYVKAQSGNTIFDAKADKSRKLISNVDKCIKLGSNPKWGTGQPLQNVNELITFRQTTRKDPAKAKKLDDAHNMLMRYATAQLKSDTLIDGTARDQYAFKKDPEEITVEDVLERIRKTANNLKVGKIAHLPSLDASKEVQDIINACTKRLTAIAKAKGGTP